MSGVIELLIGGGSSNTTLWQGWLILHSLGWQFHDRPVRYIVYLFGAPNANNNIPKDPSIAFHSRFFENS